MSVNETNKVDGIAVDYDNKMLIMLITDHLSWEKENEYKHLITLQEKINSYLAFIESKQYSDVYPNKKFELYCIEIHFKYGLNDNCNKFINVVNKQLSELNIFIRSKDKQREETGT